MSTRTALTFACAVLVATCGTSAWGRQEIAKLTAWDAGKGRGGDFGLTSGISGDYIAVGAPGDEEAGQFAGAVYVFVRQGQDWVGQVKLTPSQSGFQDGFGSSLDIEGDRLIVGAPRWEPASCFEGRAYVFRRQGETWIEEAVLASPVSTNDCFGWSVSISGERIAVGAPSAALSSGRTFVFRREGTNWVLEDTLVPSDVAQFDSFGWSVSIDADLILGGAIGDDDDGSESGSAYVFRGVGSSWFQEAKLTASNAAASDSFGLAVSVDPNTVVIGAPEKDDVGTNSGAAYVFQCSSGDWTQRTKLVSPNPTSREAFGWGTAIEGNQIAVGASGSAYLFACSGTTWSFVDTLTPSDGSQNLGGASLSVGGGLAVVGAYSPRAA